MMRALEAGGLENVYDPACNPVPVGDGPHDPIDGDLRELSIQTMLEPGFPDPAVYDGKVIKLFPPPWMPLTDIPEGDYRIIWLNRSPEARRRSGVWQDGIRKQIGPEVFRLRDAASKNAYRVMSEQRPDVEVVTIDYDAVVDEAGKVFDNLAHVYGWPIDPLKAATVPNPKRRRAKCPAKLPAATA